MTIETANNDTDTKTCGCVACMLKEALAAAERTMDAVGAVTAMGMTSEVMNDVLWCLGDTETIRKPSKFKRAIIKAFLAGSAEEREQLGEVFKGYLVVLTGSGAFSDGVTQERLDLMRQACDELVALENAGIVR